MTEPCPQGIAAAARIVNMPWGMAPVEQPWLPLAPPPLSLPRARAPHPADVGALGNGWPHTVSS
ncbi:hypothetical protein BRCON_1921 [Candidatus Sumerlaea chitinivorans]|uniref:Uncharacterized protein n=1 Tax=Sumerlaea chitinivorans TaxID=2250252 RepID=A0A2Z4Y790_SUMC1|nr:hypothetical protein BRCON_1921 [Candidatus Sumerlaea chitinivorans]